MKSFNAYIKKEFIEALRTQKFIIIAAAVMFFAVADPAFLKLMPQILKSQMGIDPSAIKQSQEVAMQNFMKDLFQISTFIIVLALSGIISGERKNKTFTIPVSMGCKVSGIVIGKNLIYGVYLFVMTMLGILTAYYYSGIIFGSDLNILDAVKSGLLFGLYFMFALSLVSFFSSLFDRGFMAGILTLIVIYLMKAVEGLFNFNRFFPTHIITEANVFKTSLQSASITSIVVAGIAVLILNLLTCMRLKKLELN
ncbi:MAG: ABC transporter permease [Bacillota bacterium]|nr:ABC transporter permease [Bacillota bacterium]